METRLAAAFRDTASGRVAEAILRACVHCGFCNATCPTYRLLGDELDGPRGRIYQIKQVLEGAPATPVTQLHLDRCLTCRNCETTCPSGVEYGRLLDIGRATVDAQVRRPRRVRALHWLLREGLTRRALFAPALRLGRALRFVLPAPLRASLAPARAAGAWPREPHGRKVLLLASCTQGALAPSIDAATARVLDALGIAAAIDARSGCCGAIRQHLGDPEGARAAARRNIDAWYPRLEAGEIEALVLNASGCAALVKDYGQLLADDPGYAARARRVCAAVRELGEFLAPERAALARAIAAPVPERSGAASLPMRVALHKPCTLQHALKCAEHTEQLLQGLGAELVPVAEAHLCCGSAGTYSILQGELSHALRTRKLELLLAAEPELVLTANIGCLAHLAAGTQVPVWHWIEWVDQALAR
ncbi:MAG TPA: glycolate oxidase subunit GlcF [Steroidobacteraceae bacterium]|nr:glycolate oxidase subunit GlcF [Steroidobacteraceae bacterium]